MHTSGVDAVGDVLPGLSITKDVDATIPLGNLFVAPCITIRLSATLSVVIVSVLGVRPTEVPA